MTGEKTDFTQGSILRKLCLFMLPVLGALILQAAYGAVDLLVVGRFGSTSGLSAVSTGGQVLNLVTFLMTPLAMGVTVLIARYLGERCPEQIGAVVGGAAVVFALVSALLFAVLVGLARPIAVVMQAPAETVTLMASYVRICGGGTFFIVAYNLLSAIFRGLGDSRSPLLFVLAGRLSGQCRGGSAARGRAGNGRGRRAQRLCLSEGLRAGDDHDRGALQHGRLLQRPPPAACPLQAHCSIRAASLLGGADIFPQNSADWKPLLTAPLPAAIVVTKRSY